MPTPMTLDHPRPSSTPDTRRDDDRRWLVLFALWLVAALLASALGVISLERRALVPAAILGGVIALTLAYFRVPSFRAFAQRIDLRIPILFHVTRLPIGIAFLVLESRGQLDPTFATRAGWGDVLAGGLAIVAALAVPTRPMLVRVWNVIGLADIVMVIGTAQWLLFFSGHPETLGALTSPGWGAIPLFVVPVVVATHLLVLARSRRSAQRDS